MRKISLPKKNYLKAESEYKRNLSKYQGLRKRLQMLNLNPQSIENGKISSVIRIYAPISGSITEKRTVKVHGHFKDEDKKTNFATGMFVEAEIITDQMNAKALPTQSIVSLDDTNYVLVLQNKTDSSYVFRRREVMLGSAFNGFTIINNISDFKQDDQFLTKGAFPLIKEE